MLNAVVQRAMEALTSRVDTKSGLGSSDEEAVAASILKQLHTAGEKFEPEALAAWASLNGWTPKGVARIRSVASGVLVGKAYAGATGVWHTDIVDKLRTDSGVDRTG